MLNVLVLEFNNHHTEVFPIYREYLPCLTGQREINLTFLVHPNKYEQLKNSAENMSPIFSRTIYWIASKTGLRTIYFKKIVKKAVEKYRPDLIIFNSIEPMRTYKTMHNITNIKKIGIVHGFGRINFQPDEKSKFFVLGEFVYNEYKDRGIDGYLLPFIPTFEVPKKEKKLDSWTIGIQGIIDFRRRDYPFLIELAKQLKETEVSLKFNIIGSLHQRDGSKLFKLVEKEGLKQYFIFHEDLDDRDFIEQLSSCDLIMTLLSDGYSRYFKNNISASFSHAAAYNIPLILSRENAKAWGINKSCVIEYESLEEIILALEDLDNEVYSEKKLNFTRFVDKKVKDNKKMIKGLLV